MINLNFGLFPGSVSGAAVACQGEGVRGAEVAAAESVVVWWGHRSRDHWPLELETNFYEV